MSTNTGNSSIDNNNNNNDNNNNKFKKKKKKKSSVWIPIDIDDIKTEKKEEKNNNSSVLARVKMFENNYLTSSSTTTTTTKQQQQQQEQKRYDDNNNDNDNKNNNNNDRNNNNNTSKPNNNNNNNSRIIDGITNDGWFTETEAMWPGQKFSLALEEFSITKSILYNKQSQYQSILVFQSAQYGNVLVLDGVIQMSARDEFAYHEMMVHTSICGYNNNNIQNKINVLIVGGGDGGVLREVVKYEHVQTITLVEIDPDVILVAKKYFNADFTDPRLTIIHADAAEYLKEYNNNDNNNNNNNKEYYNIIFGDTSDPIGPAVTLFQPIFYESMYNALHPIHGGIVCVQAECFWIHLHLISDLLSCCKTIYNNGNVYYATTMVPTYPCGQIGFIFATRNGTNGTKISCNVPVRKPPTNLKWYSSNMHYAAFILPPFVLNKLKDDDDDNENEEIIIIPNSNNNIIINDTGQQQVGMLNRGIDNTKQRHNDNDDDNEVIETDDDNNNENTNRCFLDNAIPAVVTFCNTTTNNNNNDNEDDDDLDDDDDDCFLPSCTIL